MPRRRRSPRADPQAPAPFPPVAFALDSRLDEVRRGAAAVRDACDRLGVASDDAYRIETAVVEALNNAVLHAYEDRSGHQIGLTIGLDHSDLVVEVSDSGRTMPEPPADGTEAEADWHDLAEQGRGWGIMSAWMDDVRYFQRGGWNVLQLRKRVLRETVLL